MPTDTTTDLTHASDIELDAALRVGYAAHRAADPADRLELHMAIIAILAEQTRRLDAWLTHQDAAQFAATLSTGSQHEQSTQPTAPQELHG